MKTVLIVDDDLHILDVCRLVLERAGYKVGLLNRGDTLLSGDFTEPGLFIIDRQLGGIDGLDLCRYLKQRPSFGETPVIIFSATPHIRGLSERAGADGFLEKPFRNRKLLQMVSDLLP